MVTFTLETGGGAIKRGGVSCDVSFPSWLILKYLNRPALPECTQIEKRIAMLTIPLVSDATFDITPEYMQELMNTFSDIDVPYQLNLLAAWNQANPKRRKTSRGIRRHIHTWLSKADKDVRSDNVSLWNAVVGVYFRPLSPAEVEVWESELAEALDPPPDNSEIIVAIRKVVSCPQGKPQYLNAWDVIKAIRATRKTAQAAELTEADIQAYIASIKATGGLEARWDMICEHSNPMRIEEACNRAGIPFLRPQAKIKETQQVINFKFRLM